MTQTTATESASSEGPPWDEAAELLEDLATRGESVAQIPVHISYEIIKLFSEGLYQSPQKAIEELVSNSYDAGARQVHVLVPEVDEKSGKTTRQAGDSGKRLHGQNNQLLVEVADAQSADTPLALAVNHMESVASTTDADVAPLKPLWVIDNGHGMDIDGFTQLWRVAGSQKNGPSTDGRGRAPIGQFGIGKLAAYVLAWRLTHISRVDGQIRSTTMNFKRLEGQHQYTDRNPVDLDVRLINEDEAKDLLNDVKARDGKAWSLLFDSKETDNWTVAALSDFKNLYDKLSVPRLSWVLRTGLPLHTDFQLYLGGQELVSSKTNGDPITTIQVGHADDSIAEALGLRNSGEGIQIDGIEGAIRGKATIYKKALSTGKSNQYNRSHGFFIRVRGRIINLEDELFGLDVLNHSAWSRFAMELDAEGLREHLLSSREGVRDSEPIRTLRKYLHQVFNSCRRAYDDHLDQSAKGFDVAALLKHAPSAFVTAPLIDSVEAAIDHESYYIQKPSLAAGQSEEDWIDNFSAQVSESPFSDVLFEDTGTYDRIVRYQPDSRRLVINKQHPYIDKLLSASKTQGPAALFGSAEVLVDSLLHEQGMHPEAIIDFFKSRDRILRLLAGEQPSTASEVLRLLQSAVTHETAQERAVGMAFAVLGFEYETRGGNAPGADGVLYARLGRSTAQLADYKLVYDSKQTNHPSVAADKINISSLMDFKAREDAQHGFFIAVNYAGQDDSESKLNRAVIDSVNSGRSLTMLRVVHIQKLVELHYKYGITLTRLRSLFELAHTTYEVDAWIEDLGLELSQLAPQVPLLRLLEGLQELKGDPLAVPSVQAVRVTKSEFKIFTPDRLIAALEAVQNIVGSRWIEVDRNGEVVLHHNVDQIVANFDRALIEFFGGGSTPSSPSTPVQS